MGLYKRKCYPIFLSFHLINCANYTFLNPITGRCFLWIQWSWVWQFHKASWEAEVRLHLCSHQGCKVLATWRLISECPICQTFQAIWWTLFWFPGMLHNKSGTNHGGSWQLNILLLYFADLFFCYLSTPIVGIWGGCIGEVYRSGQHAVGGFI